MSCEQGVGRTNPPVQTPWTADWVTTWAPDAGRFVPLLALAPGEKTTAVDRKSPAATADVEWGNFAPDNGHRA